MPATVMSFTVSPPGLRMCENPAPADPRTMSTEHLQQLLKAGRPRARFLALKHGPTHRSKRLQHGHPQDSAHGPKARGRAPSRAWRPETRRPVPGLRPDSGYTLASRFPSLQSSDSDEFPDSCPEQQIIPQKKAPFGACWSEILTQSATTVQPLPACVPLMPGPWPSTPTRAPGHSGVAQAQPRRAAFAAQQ